MEPGTFKSIVGFLLGALVLLAWAPWEREGDSPEAALSGEVPPGHYPPAPSRAVGMTPEWREFADQVDRICATSYNQALVVEAQMEHTAAQRGWSDSRTEKAALDVWNDQALTILRSTKALGEPPERPDLLERWQLNVARRAAFRHSAADAVADGRWGEYRDFMNRIYPLKDRGNEIGQRFGLRICTSN